MGRSPLPNFSGSNPPPPGWKASERGGVIRRQHCFAEGTPLVFTFILRVLPELVYSGRVQHLLAVARGWGSVYQQEKQRQSSISWVKSPDLSSVMRDLVSNLALRLRLFRRCLIDDKAWNRYWTNELFKVLLWSQWVIHLFPKWRQINYSFVCLIFTSKLFCALYMLTRHRGLINKQTKA